MSSTVQAQEEVKKTEVANIRYRLHLVSDSKYESTRTYWKGHLLGEINMLARLEILSRYEWMILQNEVAKAAGEYPYFKYKKVQAAKNSESEACTA